MKLNAEFSQRVAVHFDQTPWVPSPARGVQRKMLDRIGDEVARHNHRAVRSGQRLCAPYP